ncbi:hypothetical protein BDN72DRAFT_956047 [Pluteus cervinus]|uniref:Uncharacterized protein n=1 Tax=Pluteus cervinus TaxID=181527 RepID=A0ACD3B793_9AGAR|nr:hypothetical protein BDN72DRAFT_956047 [Pluteus cervinus]
MYSDCLPSSSRLTIDDTQDYPDTLSCLFPTSHLRHPAVPQPKSTQRRLNFPHAYKPLPQYTVTTRYPTSIPVKHEVTPGVWSDGQHTVLCANHPDVRALLDQARSTLSLPPSPSEIIFVLAALEVFYKPNDPAHWLFWNDDRKGQTADVVSRIALHRPQLIQSKVAWNGTPEYLSILAIHHGPGWKQLYEKETWYTTLVPPKTVSPVRIPNLRKRKPAQVDVPENLAVGDEEEDIEVPPPKRTKTRRAQSPSRPPKGILQITEEPLTHSNDAKFGLSPTPADEMVCDEDQNSPTEDSANQPEDNIVEDPPTRMTTRRQKRKAAEASSGLPEISASRSPSCTPAPASGGGGGIAATSAVVHSRNRSTSQASAETVVASNERRSQSVLSAATAVEAMHPTRKSKAPQGDGDAESVDGSVSGEIDVAPRVTRGSTRRGKKASTPKVDEDAQSDNEDAREEEAGEATAKTKKSSRSNTTKSRARANRRTTRS